MEGSNDASEAQRATMQIFLIVVMGVLGFLAVILIVYAGENWLLRHLKKPKPLSEESVRGYRQRLLNPRWDELEQHFNQAIPKRIKDLYARTEIITRQDIEVSNGEGTHHIAEFLPTDLETLDAVPENKKIVCQHPRTAVFE
jgi:hypothetical protein